MKKQSNLDEIVSRMEMVILSLLNEEGRDGVSRIATLCKELREFYKLQEKNKEEE